MERIVEIKYQKLLKYKSTYDYKICLIKDVSRPSAVRYAVQVGLKKYYDKHDLKAIIQEVTKQVKLLKKQFEYKKDLLDSEGGVMHERTPDVIWLYLNPLEFIEKKMTSTWVARSLWVTKEKAFKEREIIKPRQLGGGDVIDDIEVFWSWGIKEQLKMSQDLIAELQDKMRKS